MNPSEAANLVRVIADSIAGNPGQFHFEITVIGTQATSIGGGTGLSVQATGGGPGSTTIGYHSRVTGGDIQIAQIAQKAANEIISQEMDALVIQLRAIADETERGSPDHNRLRQLFRGLGTWVPGVITSIIGNLVTMALGIAL